MGEREDDWTLGPIIGFDLETTSADPETARIVQYGLAYFEHGEVQRRREMLVNPGIPIPAEATAIHGISDEDVADAMPHDEAVGRILASLGAKERAPVAGMNLAYDLTIIARHADGPEVPCDPALDLFVLDKAMDKFRKGRRTLTAIARHYGVADFTAHGAASDAEASVRAIIALARMYDLATVAPVALHQRQVAWRREQVESFSEYRVRNGQPALTEREGDWPIMRPPPSTIQVPDTAETQAFQEAVSAIATERDHLRQLVLAGCEAMRLTREYVGDLLPAKPGWEWFDWLMQARKALGVPDGTDGWWKPSPPGTDDVVHESDTPF